MSNACQLVPVTHSLMQAHIGMPEKCTRNVDFDFITYAGNNYHHIDNYPSGPAKKKIKRVLP